MVEDYLRQTNTLVDALDRDWHQARAAGRVPDPKWTNWAEWLAGYRKFYQDSQGFGASLTGGWKDRAKQYRLERDEWRQRLRKLGALIDSPEAPVEAEGALASWARDLAIGLGVVGISILAGALVRGKFK